MLHTANKAYLTDYTYRHRYPVWTVYIVAFQLQNCKSLTSSSPQNPLHSFTWILQTYCNSVVLVSPIFSHNALSRPLKCICQFGSSFMIWNVPQYLLKNNFSLIVPSLDNFESEKKKICSESIIYAKCSNILLISFWSLECAVGQIILT